MVTGRPLPAGTYSSDDAGDFRVLRRHAEFPDAAASALAALGRSVSFRGGQADFYPPSYVLWPVGDGTLVARIADAGLDAYRRPHRIRVDGVWVGVRSPEPGGLAVLLSAAAWPADIAPDDTVSFKSTTPDDGVTAAVTTRGRVLVAATTELDATGFDLRIGPAGGRHTFRGVSADDRARPLTRSWQLRGWAVTATLATVSVGGLWLLSDRERAESVRTTTVRADEFKRKYEQSQTKLGNAENEINVQQEKVWSALASLKAVDSEREALRLQWDRRGKATPPSPEAIRNAIKNELDAISRQLNDLNNRLRSLQLWVGIPAPPPTG